MIYPDKETLQYNYNLGGLLHSFGGNVQGTDSEYVKQLGYDKFEQRVYIATGMVPKPSTSMRKIVADWKK